jgi:hypothetical protein
MSDYSDTQQAKNEAYRQAYNEWVAHLPPRKRKELEAQGLLTPSVDRYHIGKPCDVADLSLAAEEAEQSELAEEEAEATWAALRRLISELLADPNPALGLDCLALVSGIGFLGESMTVIAKRHKVTRAAVSKRCIQWTRLLRLMPSRSMRSLTARQAYRTAQNQIHSHREQFDSSRLSPSTNRPWSDI